MTSEDRPLCLFDALRSWSDPKLVEAVRVRERRYTAIELSGARCSRLVPDTKLRMPPRDNSLSGISLSWLYAAWDALERDFKRRLTRGELFAAGVEAAPKRGIAHVPIPGVWAADFVFDFDRDVIKVGTGRYTAVLISRTEWIIPSPESVREPATPPNRESDAGAASQPFPSAGEKETAGERGRASMRPVIAQAVRDYWPDVCAFVRRQGGERPNWSELARMLHKRMDKAASTAPGVSIPHQDTIRTRLPDIYAEVLSEKTVRN
jgi:hypothetical protein